MDIAASAPENIVTVNEELWVSIRGCSNYEISNHGRLRNVTTNNTLNGSSSAGGVLITSIRKDGEDMKSINVAIHRLVAKAWVPNTHNRKNISHIDGDKHNNRADNLEWVNAAESARRGWRNNMASNLYARRRNRPL